MEHNGKRIQRRGFIRILVGVAACLCIATDGLGEVGTEQGPLFSFGVVADAQYCDYDPAGTRYYRNSLAKLAACVKDFNAEGPACVIHLGDFIDRDFASFDKPLAIYNRLRAPHYHVLGNHDFSVADGDKGKVRHTLGVGKGYYTFAHDTWRFIVLDGNDVGMNADAQGSEKYRQGEAAYQRLKESGAPNAQVWNGGVGAEQVAWLKETLDKAAAAGEKAILLCHFPVFPPSEHTLWNDHEIVDLIDSYDCVVAYINGHNHAGNYGERNGVHYLTIRGMVETADTTAYAVIDVYGDRLVVHGRGREPSRTLAIRSDCASAPPLRDTIVRRAMGTEFTFILYARPGDKSTSDIRMIADEAFEAIEDLESRLSRWLPDSHTAYINKHAARKPVRVAGDILNLILFAKQVHEETGGAFDITVGPLIKLWEPYRKEGRLPKRAEIEEARSKIGLDKVIVDRAAGTVSFTQEGALLDFGGIGKGLAVDVAAKVLKSYGVTRALLNGGNSTLLAVGAPPGKAGWTVHVKNPYDRDRSIAEFTICDEAFSVSGKGETAFEVDGTTYGHIYDPRTGWPVEGIFIAAAFAPSGMLSDALSTAFAVLGEQRIREYCQTHAEIRATLVHFPKSGEPEVRCMNFPEAKEIS